MMSTEASRRRHQRNAWNPLAINALSNPKSLAQMLVLASEYLCFASYFQILFINCIIVDFKTKTKSSSAQVLGLTSYSRWEGAAELRRCLPTSVKARQLLLETALHRLDRFLHVGIFDRLEESIASLAATLNISLSGPSWVVSQAL